MFIFNERQWLCERIVFPSIKQTEAARIISLYCVYNIVRQPLLLLMFIVLAEKQITLLKMKIYRVLTCLVQCSLFNCPFGTASDDIKNSCHDQIKTPTACRKKKKSFGFAGRVEVGNTDSSQLIRQSAGVDVAECICRTEQMTIWKNSV